MSESSEDWRKPLEPQTISVNRKPRAHEDLPDRSIRIKESEFIGSGSSGVVRAIQAELERQPRLFKDPLGWLFPKVRELKGFALKIIRTDRVGEALESYARCQDAGLTVPSTYRHLELRDGRSAILMPDLRQNGYTVAQPHGIQAEASRPTGRMERIENLDTLLKSVFDDVMLASRYKSYGILLGGDPIFFLMPQRGGIGEVKHIFFDFDRMHDQANYNSTTLARFEGMPREYQQEVTRINIASAKKSFETFIKNFVDEKVQGEYASKLASWVQRLSAETERS